MRLFLVNMNDYVVRYITGINIAICLQNNDCFEVNSFVYEFLYERMKHVNYINRLAHKYEVTKKEIIDMELEINEVLYGS